MDTVLDSALRIPDLFSNFFTKFYVSVYLIFLNAFKLLHVFQRPFLRSRYDLINLVEFEEDIYDQDLRQKFRRIRPRRRR